MLVELRPYHVRPGRQKAHVTRLVATPRSAIQ
jgi:hypothetical protein